MISFFELLELYFIFFKVGLFTIGGGLAAIPLLHNEFVGNGWIVESQFADMIAISESTPGPIGVNMATFIGFDSFGIIGSIVATIGMVTPSIIIICIIARYLRYFNENKVIKSVLYGLRPAVTGLIAAAAFSVALIAIFDVDSYANTKRIIDFFNIRAMILFIGLYIATHKWKKHPIFYIILSGIIGIIIF